LKDFYESVNEEKKLEIVFVSSDDSAEAAAAYMKEAHGDWLAIRWDSPLRELLKKRYGFFAGKEQVKFSGTERKDGIPTLAILNPDGSVFIADGVSALKNSRRSPQSLVEQWPVWP
jgi:hypothetical protein